jgi:hypothetical protein
MRTNAIFNIASMTAGHLRRNHDADGTGQAEADDPVSKYLGAAYEHPQVISKFNEKDATYETRPAP